MATRLPKNTRELQPKRTKSNKGSKIRLVIQRFKCMITLNKIEFTLFQNDDAVFHIRVKWR